MGTLLIFGDWSMKYKFIQIFSNLGLYYLLYNFKWG